MVWTFVFSQFSCFCPFLRVTVASPSCLFTYSVAASCSHAAVMWWMVSDSFPHLLRSSSMSGCFKIYLLFFLFTMTWPSIAVRKPSVSANKAALVSHLFDASISTCSWSRSYGCRPCKAFWDHCLLTVLIYSSVASLLLLLLLLLLLTAIEFSLGGVNP